MRQFDRLIGSEDTSFTRFSQQIFINRGSHVNIDCMIVISNNKLEIMTFHYFFIYF